MDLRYHAGTSIRHGVAAMLEAALVVAVAGALVFGFAVVTGNDPSGADHVFAGKGHNASTASSSISLDSGGDLRLGGKVTFTSNAANLGGGEYPMIIVACYSDSNGDKVYAQLDHPDTVFVLGGGSSKWWGVGGGADCKATLYAYGGKEKGYDTIRELAGPAEFHAAG